MHGLFAEITHRFQKPAAEKRVELAINVEPGATLHSDREWLALALQNLVGNAVKFSFQGTVTVRCSRRPHNDASACVISVADEGPGIAPERLHDIFQMFSRGETHGQSGVGLGLAVASQAARLLGAELTVKSQLGVGSTFEMIFADAGNSGS